MRPAAQIYETVVAVGADHLARVDFALINRFDDLHLEGLVGENLHRFGFRHLAANERLVGGNDVRHLPLDAFQIFRGERPADVEVVVEAILDRRTDRERSPVEETQYRLSQDVGRGMAQHMSAFFSLIRNDLEAPTLWQRSCDIQPGTVKPYCHGCFGEPRTNTLGDLIPG